MATQFDDTTADHKVSTAGNWSAGVPDSADAVTFGAAVTSMIIDTAMSCLSFSTAAASGVAISGSGALSVYGNFTLAAADTWTNTGILSTYTNACAFTSGGNDLSTIPSLHVRGGADLTLVDALVITGKPLYVYGAGSSLTTGNFQIDCSIFGDNGQAGAITLSPGTSVINCSNVSFAAATVTTTSGMAPTINLTSTVDVTANFGGVDWHETSVVAVITSAKTLTLSGANTIGNFAISWTGSSSVNELSLGANQTIPGIFNVAGQATVNHCVIKSSVKGTQRTITAGTVTITDGVDFQDIKGAGAGNWNPGGQIWGNAGGNSDITFRTPANYYACTLTANRLWTANIWSATNDGTADGASVYPLPQDTAILNDNSGDNSNKTLTINLARNPNIDASALTESLTLIFSGSTLVYLGDLILTGSGLTVTSTSATITIDGRLKNEAADTLDINILPAIGSGAVTINSYGGTVRLLTNDLTTTGTLTRTRGTLDTNGRKLYCNIDSSSNSNTRVLQDTGGGGGIIQTAVTGTVIDMSTDTNLSFGTGANAPTFTLGNSAKTLTGNVTANFGASVAKTLAGLNFKKHAGDFSYILLGIGNNYGAVTQETPDATYQFNKVQWGNSASQKNLTSYNVTGHASYPCYIQSDSAGVPAHLTDTDAGTNTFVNCNIKDMHVTGGLWIAAGCTDVSGNDGWIWSLGGGSLVGGRLVGGQLVGGRLIG